MTGRRRLLGRLELLVTALLALCVWFVVTALATRPALKVLIDLTPQAQFSVSGETTDLLAGIAKRGEKVRIDTFFQRPAAPTNELEARVAQIQARVHELTRDLLVRYAELGGDNVEVVNFDVLSDVAASRQRIQEIGGLRREDVIVVSLGKRHRELQLLSDLAELDVPPGRSMPTPGQRSVPLPSLKLFKGEEAISSALRSLLVEGAPRIYFLSGYQEASLDAPVADSYSELMAALNAEGFQIARWNLENEGHLPDDAAVIGLIEPHVALSQRAVEQLATFVRGGGRMFVNVAWSNVDAETRRGTLDELGTKLGFQFSSDVVCHLVPDPAHPQSPGVDGPRARLLTTVPNAGHKATRPLAEQQRYPQTMNAREIRVRDAGADLSFEPLLQTGRYGWLAPFDPRISDADTDQPQNSKDFGPRTVAAVVEASVKEGGRSGAVVLVGGIAFLNQVFAQNSDLALDLFNWLARREELVSIRGNRYLAQKMALAPQQLERARDLLLMWAPGSILVCGFIVLFLRRRR
ncbi:MAG: Gldg family protein [Planctomycetota bacterium]